MIAKPKMYDGINIIEEYEKISLGGHKGIIMKAEEYTSPQSGKTSLKVSVDTSKDDKQPEYFAEQYRNDTRPDRRWSNSAIKYISLGEEENQVRMLKEFITAYENSNNCEFDWSKDWTQLTNKKIGGVFGMEEYEDAEGKLRTNNKLRDFRSIDKVDNVQIPKIKLLDGSYISYDDYMERKEDKFADFKDCVEINEEQLPF